MGAAPLPARDGHLKQSNLTVLWVLSLDRLLLSFSPVSLQARPTASNLVTPGTPFLPSLHSHFLPLLSFYTLSPLHFCHFSFLSIPGFCTLSAPPTARNTQSWMSFIFVSSFPAVGTHTILTRLMM